MRENPHVDLALPMEVVCRRDTPCLNLPGRDPRRLQRLQAVLTEGDGVSPTRLAAGIHSRQPSLPFIYSQNEVPRHSEDRPILALTCIEKQSTGTDWPLIRGFFGPPASAFEFLDLTGSGPDIARRSTGPRGRELLSGLTAPRCRISPVVALFWNLSFWEIAIVVGVIALVWIFVIAPRRRMGA